MLVLSRKQQEQILVGEKIRITVVRIQGSTVRIGIEAPDDVRILRGEVQQKEAAAAKEHVSTQATEPAGLAAHVARRRNALEVALPQALFPDVNTGHAV